MQRRGLAHEPDEAVVHAHVARHAGGERTHPLRVLGRVVVAVLGREREPLERVEADRLRVAERAERLARDDRLELAEPAAHRPVLEHEREPPDGRGAEPAVGGELGERHHRRPAVEPQRVQLHAHGLGIRVAEREDHLGLRSRRLGGDQLDRGDQIDRRAARCCQLRTKGLGFLAVPADNQHAGAGESVVIHTQT